MAEPAYSIKTLSERWGCCDDVIYKMLTNGDLKGFKVGVAWRILPEVVHAYESGETK